MASTAESNRSAPDTAKMKGKGTKRERLGWDDMKILILFLCFVLAIEGIASSLWSWSVNGASVNGKTLSGVGVFATGMICSGAASLVGGLLGFLFGIPRSVESNAGRLRLTSPTAGAQPGVVASEPPSASPPSVATHSPAERLPLLRVNTNLEDISDAVTKVLLGAGLAEASSIVEGAGKLATFLGPSFGPGDGGQAVAIATIVYGVLEGFLAGYLTTRLYLTSAFERNDPQTFGTS